MPAPADKLAREFHYRLATPTRANLVGALSGEPSPVENFHSIVPSAFL